MQNLKNLLTTSLPRQSLYRVVTILVLAILGFSDATYLTIKHLKNIVPPCGITAGCETVLTSQYSDIFGIPVALLGAIFYLMIAIGCLIYLESKNQKIIKYTFLFSIFGFIAALWFVFLQIFILKAYCVYCLFTAGISASIFILSYTTFCSRLNTQGKK